MDSSPRNPAAVKANPVAAVLGAIAADPNVGPQFAEVVDPVPHVGVPAPELTAAQRVAFGDEDPERWDGQS